MEQRSTIRIAEVVEVMPPPLAPLDPSDRQR
jgi:hypothetical protein